MAIIISNITAQESQGDKHKYSLRIDDLMVCTFKHQSSSYGLSRLLRDAADEVDSRDREKLKELNVEVVGAT